MAINSGILGGYVYAYQPVPSLYFYEWDVDDYTPPDGYRNVVSGVSSFAGVVDNTNANAMVFDRMVVDHTELQPEYSSKVQCVTFINTTGTFAISNMRFWMTDDTALTNSDANLEFAISGVWVQGATMPSGYGEVVPTSLPDAQNVRRTDCFPKMKGLLDNDTSEYIYMGMTVPSGTALGQYGAGINGDLQFRVTYDWYNSVSQPSTSGASSGVTPVPPVPSAPYIVAYGTPGSGWNEGVFDVSKDLQEPASESGDLLFAFVGQDHYEDITTVLEPPATSGTDWQLVLDGSTEQSYTWQPDIWVYYRESYGTGAESGVWTITSGYGDMNGFIFNVRGGADIVGSGISWLQGVPNYTPATTGAATGTNLVLHIAQWEWQDLIYGVEWTLDAAIDYELRFVSLADSWTYSPIQIASEEHEGTGITTAREMGMDTVDATTTYGWLGQIIISPSGS